MQGVVELRKTLSVSEFEIDEATLAWFLRDRKLDQEKAAKKVPCPLDHFAGRGSTSSASVRAGSLSPSSTPQVKAYLAWRAQGNDKLSYKDVQAEASTGKASLLSIRDVVRALPCPSRASRPPSHLRRRTPALAPARGPLPRRARPTRAPTRQRRNPLLRNNALRLSPRRSSVARSCA